MSATYEVYQARLNRHGRWEVLRGEFRENYGSISSFFTNLDEDYAKAIAAALNQSVGENHEH